MSVKSDLQLLKIDYLCTLSTAATNSTTKFQFTTKCCILCNTNFTNHYDYIDHTNEHLNNFFYDRLKWLKISDIIDLGGNNKIYDEKLRDMTSSRFIVNVIKIHDTTVEFDLKNIDQQPINIQHIFMYHPTNIILYINEDIWPKMLAQDSKVNFFIHRNLFNLDNHKYPIYIHFSVNKLQSIEYWELNVTKSLEIELPKPVQNNTQIKNKNGLKEKSMKLNKLKLYKPQAGVRKILEKQTKKSKSDTTSKDATILKLIDDLTTNKPNNLNATNYLKALVLFADMEDICIEIMIRRYNLKNIKLDQLKSYHKINVANLSESRPSILVNDRLTLHCKNLQKYVGGTILEINRDYILVNFTKAIDMTLRYDVYFIANRSSLRMEKYAIELMNAKKLTKFMFPNELNVKNIETKEQTNDFDWFNKSVGANVQQNTAVHSIYNGSAYPYPFVLFGPPGTGKTTTLVESILQLWKNKPESRILIVSTSNFACNVISKCLLKYLQPSELYRLFSKSQEEAIDKIDDDVLNISNLQTMLHYYPPLAELYLYRIIITTLTTSGRLIQGGFSCTFFTHLFIDECGSCTEGSCLIPIAGLISTNNTISANIILAGDPLQLGPIVQSSYADNLGYGISLIERLMKYPVYQKNESTREYNKTIIVKLIENYRSHKDILHVSNEIFYDSELKALGSDQTTKWALNWHRLPNPKFPIIFHSVSGKTEQDKDSPSFYNKDEINQVMKYIKLLVNRIIMRKTITQSDIAVITPYRKQCQKIRTLCDHRKWTEIEVASVEAFQGNEKPVIILSTVRSNMKTLGFLSNERRLNVALTRAQALLIIVGDPIVLKMDKHWFKLIEFCHSNKAITGTPFKL